MAKAKSGNSLEWEARLSAAEFNRALEELRTNTGRTAKEINQVLGGEVIKKIKLETVTDESGARRLVAVDKERLTVVDQIRREQDKLNRISQNSVTSLRQQVNQAKQARDEMAKYVSKSGDLSGRLTEINGKWVSQNQKVKALEQQLARASASGFWDRLKADLNLGGITNFTSNLVALTQGFQAVSIVVGQFTGAINDSVDAVSRLQQFALTFKAIGQGASGGVQALQESSRIALNLGTNINTVREGFQQLSPVVLNSGGTIQDVSNIVQSLSSRFAAFGISGDRARRVTNGVIQAFAKGKLQAEELTQQISEADPAFKTDFAKAIGVSVQELERLVKAGRITSDVLIKKIPLINKTALLYGKLGTSATDAVNSLASGNVTIEQVRNKLASLSQLNFEAFAKSIQPILVGFLRIQAVVTDFVASIGKLAVTKTLGIIFSEVARQAIFLIESFVRIAEAVLVAVDPIARVINFLLKIPGVAQIIGLAILSKVVEPLGRAAVAFKQTAKASIGFVDSISSSASGPLSKSENLWSRLNTSITNVGKNLATTGSISGKSTKQLSTQFQSYTRLVGSAEKNLERLRGRLAQLQQIQLGGMAGDIGPTIQATSTKIARYESLIASTKLKTQALGLELQGTGKGFGFLGTAARATGNAITGIVGAAASSIRSLAVALGPVGIAFAALSVVISAFKTGTAAYDAEIEKSRGTIEALNAATAELGGTGSQKLEGFALLWANFSSRVADAGRVILGVIDAISNALNNISGETSRGFGSIGKELTGLLVILGGAGTGLLISGGNPLGALIGGLAAGLIVLAGAGSAASAEMTELKEKFTGASNAIKGQVKATDALGGALVAQASKANGSVIQLEKLLPQYRQYNASIDQLKTRQGELKTVLDATNKRIQQQQQTVDRAADSLKKLDDANKKNQDNARARFPTEGKKAALEKEKKLLEDLRSGAKPVEDAFNQIGQRLRELETTTGKVNKAFASLFEVKGDPGRSIFELSEALKSANQNLESAVPNSKAFVSAISEVSSAEFSLKKLKDAASDPINIVGANAERIKLLKKEIQDLSKKIAEDKKLNLNSEDIKRSQQELNILQAQLREVTESDVNIKIDLKLQEFDFQQQLKDTLNKSKLILANIGLFDQGTMIFGKNAPAEAAKIGNTVLRAFGPNRTFEDFIQLGIGLAPEEVVKVREQIFGIQEEITSRLNKLAKIDIELAKTNLAPARILELERQKALITTEIGNKTLAGAEGIARAGKQLREEIEAGANRIQNLKLSNLRFLPREEQQKVLQQLDQDVRDILQREGLQSRTFFGTPEQIAQEKQAFVNFYRELRAEKEKALNQRAALDELITFSEKIQELGPDKVFEKMANQIQESVKPMNDVTVFSETLAGYMIIAANAASSLKTELIEINKLRSPRPGRWTGGPVTPGTTYRINELGKEGFLDRSGDLSLINRPRNALWTPSRSGTVIPAHIMANLVPTGARVSSPTAPSTMRRMSSQGGSAAASLIASSNNNLNASIKTLATSQAYQATEIAKLGHAVQELSSRDWNVNVAVNQQGDGGLRQSRIARSLR